MPFLLLLRPSVVESAWRRRSRSISTTRFPAVARRYVHEGHVRTQDAESLGQCVAAGFPDDDAALVLAFEEGNVTQERGADVLFDVLAAADGRVEHADQVDDAEGDRKAGQQADAQDDHRTGRHGPGAAVCLVDRTRIAFGDGIV